MKANQSKTSSKRLNSRKPETKPEPLEETRAFSRNSGAAPTPDDVATAAYYNYLNEGRPTGQALKHWLDAEAQMGGAPSAR